MLVTVNEIMVSSGITVALGFGVEEGTGKAVVFGGDHRAMLIIRQALTAGGPIRAEVDGWQLLGGSLTPFFP